MDAYDSRLIAAAKQRLSQTAESEMMRLVESEASDFADYRARTGIIKGLKLAVQIIEAVEKEFGREPDQAAPVVSFKSYED